MAEKPISTPLPADLPTNWQTGQTVSPTGTEVGLTQRHGYNYQAQQINNAQTAINTINDAFENVYGDGDTVPVADGGTGAKTPQEALVNLGAASNPNLLDNWYFVGGGSQQGGGQFPINQRGQTSYTGAGYKIDRWAINNGIGLSLQGNGLQMQFTSAMYLRQPLENPDKLQGQTITISGIFTNTQSLDGVVLRARVNGSFENRLVNVTGDGLFSMTTVLPDSIETMTVEVGGNPGSQLTIIALKLELGPVQTLAHQDAEGNWLSLIHI